jgi:exo-1,4-beta-D-glucosaminidase
MSKRLASALLLAVQTIQAQDLLVSEPGQVAPVPNWDLQSSSSLPDDISSLSTPGVDTSSWHHAPVSKCTLMGCLLEAGELDDEQLFFSDNLRRVDWGQFTVPWVYRNEFALRPGGGSHFLLQTNGITSRADMYLNGELVADKTVQNGAYAGHEYDITDLVAEENALVVQTYPTDYYYDLALGFIDWNPWPADNGTGIWRDITIKQTGPASLDSIRALVDIEPATVKLQIEAKNLEDKEVEIVAEAVITGPSGEEEVSKSQTATLKSGETRLLEFEHTFDKPQLWWPKQWGEQPLYTAKITVSDDAGLSDAVESTFGLRTVTSELNSHQDILYSINGIPFQVIGAGYAPDLYLRWDPARFEAIVKYMLDIGLNTIRLEGHNEHAELYEITNRLGLMVMAGWQCCNKWEAWDYNEHFEPIAIWDDGDYAAANASIIHETKFLQPHPSTLTFLIGSDFHPNDRAAEIYLDGLRANGWQLPVVAAASKRVYSDLLEPSGMKMEGPYDWVPPGYFWDVDAPAEDRYGAAFGFGSELGAGVGTPEIGSLKRFLSESDLEDLWTQPDKGLFHMSTNVSQFYTRSIYNEGLWKRYGEPTSLEDYLRKAQVMDYETIRAEHEAFAARWSEEHPATGMIYWMLNNACEFVCECWKRKGGADGCRAESSLEPVR